MKRRLAALSLTGLLALTVGCSAPDSSSAPTSASATTTATADPAVTKTPTTVAPGSDVGVPGLVALRTVALADGSYVQTTLAPDNPLLTYNPDIVQQNVKDLYSSEDILAAQTVLVTFLAEEGLDSSLADNMTPAVRQTWFDANRNKFTANNPEMEAAVLTADNTQGLLNSYRQDQRPGYSLAHDGGPRVTDENINLIQVYLDENSNPPAVAIQTESTISRRTDATNAKPLEEFKATNVYGALKENDQWKINSWQNYWTTTKVGNRDEPEDLSASPSSN